MPAESTPASPSRNSPWRYVPLLYFMQAIPVSLVQDVSSVIYKDLGVANEPITLWTSLIALPWSLQLLLGPLVDLTSTKRSWVMRCQLGITAALALAPFALHLPNAFALSLGAFFVAAIFSSLCNTAMDGFYLVTMPREDQARFVGVQTTCYRLGTMFAKGFLVFLAGFFVRSEHLNQTIAWSIVLLLAAAIFGLGYVAEQWVVPKPPGDAAVAGVGSGELQVNINRTLLIVGLAICGYFAFSGWWRIVANAVSNLSESLSGWRLHGPALFLGIDLHLSPAVAETAQAIVCAALFMAMYPLARKSISGTPMADAFSSYFRQSGIVPILFFLMFYRFGEAMVAKMSILFLKDSVAHGGMGLSNEQVGAIKGVVGVLGIVFGGLLGGWVVSRRGLKRSFWPIAILMHLPNLLYLWAATTHPPIWTLYIVDFTDQFGYGFGFAGYIVFQMFVAQRGNYKTAHYALGVGIGALFIQVAGILSGILQANLGYPLFFVSVIVLTLPGLATLFFIPLED